MPYEFPRCQIFPQANHEASFQIDGVERTRWHYGKQYPRPFFYPLVGPTGSSLTRMGHPGAVNHDHHRSVWFAHNKVLGIDFWSDNSDAVIQQKQWYAYRDGNDEAIMAGLTAWYDGHDPQELLEQEIVAAVRPVGEAKPNSACDFLLEIQTTFRPKADSLEFQQTNFGFLAVRVAKNIAEHFGGGLLTNSAGAEHEKNIFGKPARWMDYSGPVPAGTTEGITYFDHPNNPGFPNSWHVREDGWMGCSPCMHGALTTTKAAPLTVRFLLHVHSGPIDADRANDIQTQFSKRPGFEVGKSTVKHNQFGVWRTGELRT